MARDSHIASTPAADAAGDAAGDTAVDQGHEPTANAHPAAVPGLGTEDHDPALADLDLLSNQALVSLSLFRERDVLRAIAAAQPQIEQVLEQVTASLLRGGRLIYVGAGTAGRIAALDATEVPPTYGVAPGTVLALVAGGMSALIDAREGDEDDAGAGGAVIDDATIGPDDVVVGVSASGSTPFVLAAVARANERGATTVALVCNADTPLAQVCAQRIEVLTGPELIVGSTRLKAGTAQKTVLNLLSTLAMVRLGRTYGNVMVSADPVNAKLARRAVRSVEIAAEVTELEAQLAIDRCGGSAPAAVVMLLTGCSSTRAQEVLAETGGNVRAAIAALL